MLKLVIMPLIALSNCLFPQHLLNVSLIAVINQKYQVQVHDEYVISGNTAVLKCQVPSYVSDFVVITAWIQDNGLHLYPNTDIGGKYNVLSNGDLYINNAGPSDAYTTYSCRSQHRLTGEVQMSTYPGRIIVTEPKGFVQPRINVEKQATKHAIVHGQIVLSCIAQVTFINFLDYSLTKFMLFRAIHLPHTSGSKNSTINWCHFRSTIEFTSSLTVCSSFPK